MTKTQLFSASVVAGSAVAALAGPAGAHHDTRDCTDWRGQAVVDHDAARVEAQRPQLFSACPSAPGVAVELADGTRLQAFVRTDRSFEVSKRCRNEKRRAKRCRL